MAWLGRSIAYCAEPFLSKSKAELIFDVVLVKLRRPDVKLVACDLSASPLNRNGRIEMLYDLHDELAARNIACCVLGTHGQLRDLLQSDGLAEKTAKADWIRTLD
jgi:hypothetical protein